MDNLFLLLFLVSIIALIFGLIKPNIFARFLKERATRKGIAIVFSISAVVSFVLFGITTEPTTQTQQITQEKKISENTEIALPTITNEELLEYEIAEKNVKGTVLILRIYIAEKDDSKIVRLTDNLIEENKSMTHIFIDYFDDRQAAEEYFAKFDERSETEEEQMFTHYIAKLIYNTTNNYKVLSKIRDGEEVKLKKY